MFCRGKLISISIESVLSISIAYRKAPLLFCGRCVCWATAAEVGAELVRCIAYRGLPFPFIVWWAMRYCSFVGRRQQRLELTNRFYL